MSPVQSVTDVPVHSPPGAADGLKSDSSAPSLLTALQEQLGLKLESTKEPVDVIVIDSAERPTPN